MIRGTTPDIAVRVMDENVDLTAAEAVYATIVQGKNKITKTTEDLSGLTAKARLEEVTT